MLKYYISNIRYFRSAEAYAVFSRQREKRIDKLRLVPVCAHACVIAVVDLIQNEVGSLLSEKSYTIFPIQTTGDMTSLNLTTSEYQQIIKYGTNMVQLFHGLAKEIYKRAIR